MWKVLYQRDPATGIITETLVWMKEYNADTIITLMSAMNIYACNVGDFKP